MRNKCVFSFGAAALLAAGVVSSTSAQSVARDGTYQIVSGSFFECCGIAGPRKSSLPSERQSFVRLKLSDDRTFASMAFVGADASTVLSEFACTSAPLLFSFDFGFASSNSIFFHVDPGPSGIYWSYSVSNSADELHIDGLAAIASSLCADVPNRFNHSNVVAVLQPVASIGVSPLEICWESMSNRTYQVKYTDDLSATDWFNLGGPTAGTGGRQCVSDTLPPADARRFYRVTVVPSP